MKIAIVAGEKSGDYLGAKLIKALKKRYPDAQFVGLAGPLMIAQGAQSLADMDTITVMGLDGLFEKLGGILKLRKALYQHFIDWQPDVFIGIDVPDFNLTLELKLRQAGIKTVHYVSPTVWAWRGGRIKKIKRAAELMLTLFPFEADYYKQQNMPVEYVSHPLANEILNFSPDAAYKPLPNEEGTSYIACLPGSRKSEIKRLLEPILGAARQLYRNDSSLKFVIPAANEHLFDLIREQLTAEDDGNILLLNGYSREVLAQCDMALLASGTAALEAALFKKPMLVVYKVSFIASLLVRWTKRVEHFSMPNHLVKPPVVPELIQDQVSVDNIVREMSRLIKDQNYRDSMQQALSPIIEDLKGEGGELAADAIQRFLEHD